MINPSIQETRTTTKTSVTGSLFTWTGAQEMKQSKIYRLLCIPSICVLALLDLYRQNNNSLHHTTVTINIYRQAHLYAPWMPVVTNLLMKSASNALKDHSPLPPEDREDRAYRPGRGRPAEKGNKTINCLLLLGLKLVVFDHLASLTLIPGVPGVPSFPSIPGRP